MRLETGCSECMVGWVPSYGIKPDPFSDWMYVTHKERFLIFDCRLCGQLFLFWECDVNIGGAESLWRYLVPISKEEQSHLLIPSRAQASTRGAIEPDPALLQFERMINQIIRRRPHLFWHGLGEASRGNELPDNLPPLLRFDE